jgi:hypothetical protein
MAYLPPKPITNPHKGGVSYATLLRKRLLYRISYVTVPRYAQGSRLTAGFMIGEAMGFRDGGPAWVTGLS